MSAVVARPENESLSWGSNKAKRTKAMPKTTLFGSALEMQTDKQKEEAAKIDLQLVDEAVIKRSKQKNQPKVTFDIPERTAMIKSQHKLQNQMSQLANVEDHLKVLEESSKYFRVGLLDTPSGKHTAASEEGDARWFSKKDLEHASEMNAVGVGKSTRSFNHDKYKHSLETHQYRLIGDVLAKGNDFSRIQPRHPTAMYQPPKPTRRVYKLEPFLPSTEPKVELPINLPPNIQHQFGTIVCNHLLHDKSVVDSTLEAQRKQHDQFYKRAKEKPLLTRARTDVESRSSNDRMGGVLRTNMFPGYSQDHKASLAHSVYTRDVYDRRDHIPDEHRYQRDALSTWAEHNVLRERTKKAWDQYQTQLTAKA